MIKILRNAHVYAPDDLGINDILIIGNKIASIEKNIKFDINNYVDIEEIDCNGNIAVPGFIDCHVHIMGGGGEGGYSTRTPEATLTDFTKCGVTTVVGCLGTDGITRNMVSLLAKARALDEEGITTYIYTGSYRLPLTTITDSIMKDIITIDKIIGIGEIAISDHRSSQPSFDEFSKAVADVRVGGMLSGKAGVINVHLGDGTRRLDLIRKVCDETEVPITQFLPTHVNRNPELFDECVEFAKQGGYIDFTASDDPDKWEKECGEISFSKGLKRLLDEGVNINNITLSSDGQGSLPIFDEKGEFLGLGVGNSSTLLSTIKLCVKRDGIPLDQAIRSITINPAKILKFKNKGELRKNYDADICILNSDTLDIDTVISKGNIMIDKGTPVVFGTFEKRK